MTSENFVLGLDAKCYYLSTGTRATWDSPGAAPANLTELTNIKDLTLNLETGKADVTTRGSGGWRQSAATLKSGTIEFEMIWDPSDAGFTEIKTAWENSTSLAIAALTEAKDEVNSEGLWADMVVTNFSLNQPLEEAQTVSVSLEPARSSVAPEWVTVST